MIRESTNQRLPPKGASKYLLTPKVIAIDKIEVIQTRFVKGASKSNLSLFANKTLFATLFTK